MHHPKQNISFHILLSITEPPVQTVYTVLHMLFLYMVHDAFYTTFWNISSMLYILKKYCKWTTLFAQLKYFTVRPPAYFKTNMIWLTTHSSAQVVIIISQWLWDSGLTQAKNVFSYAQSHITCTSIRQSLLYRTLLVAASVKFLSILCIMIGVTSYQCMVPPMQNFSWTLGWKQ